MMCDCRAAVNERLAITNSKIAEGLVFSLSDAVMDVSPPMIMVDKINRNIKGKLPVLLATCCPFCGERYAPAGDPA